MSPLTKTLVVFASVLGVVTGANLRNRMQDNPPAIIFSCERVADRGDGATGLDAFICTSKN